jgi:hypothetical protein
MTVHVENGVLMELIALVIAYWGMSSSRIILLSRPCLAFGEACEAKASNVMGKVPELIPGSHSSIRDPIREFE